MSRKSRTLAIAGFALATPVVAYLGWQALKLWLLLDLMKHVGF